jgi:hypothetical protein
MPKKLEEPNNLGLDESLVAVWEGLVSSAETRQLSTRAELENVYNEIWNRNDTALAKAIKELGKDDINAQESVLTYVKSYLVRMMNTPVYKIIFRKINYQESFFEEKDDNNNPIKGTSYPATSVLGIGILENTKTGVRYSPRFVQATAYRESAKKLKLVEDNDVVIIHASGEKNPGESTFIRMRVDARANDAETVDGDVDIPTMEEYIKENFDVTTVSQAEERLSNDNNDWRLLQGIITYGPLFPRGKKYAKFEITDVSITLDDSDSKGSAANVQVFAERDLVLSVGAGQGSKVQVLGSVTKSKDPRYNNIAMWWPKMIIPKFKVPIDDKYKPVVDTGEKEEAENTNDYLAERLKTEETKKEEKTTIAPVVTDLIPDTPIEEIEEKLETVEETKIDIDAQKTQTINN